MTQLYRYDPNFLTKQEADDLFAFVQAFPRVRPQNPMNASLFLRRTSVAHWNDYGISATMMRTNQTTRLKRTEQKKYPQMDAAPWQIRRIAIKLSLLATKPVNYISILGYENETDHIDFHQHAEDRARDARVFIVSLGETRTFGLREICPACRVCDDCNEAACDGHKRTCVECVVAKQHRKKCRIIRDRSRWINLQPAHGSLIVLPNDCNWTHEHAVLDDKTPKGLRISFNTKCLPTDESLEDFIVRMEQPTKISPTVPYIPVGYAAPTSAPTPEFALTADDEPITSVWHCLKHPYDVYIGRRMFRFGLPESDFANRSGGDYEPWLVEKLKDPLFADKVRALHGKRLACWCRDNPKRDFSKCHGHILARYADTLWN